MAETQRVPPGRAGRLWLIGRLAAARTAVDLLDRKLRLLLIEQERAHASVHDTEQRWHHAWRDADAWGTRAALLGGRKSVQSAAPVEPAEVSVAWADVMGVHYPRSAVVRMPDPVDVSAMASTALDPASEAYRKAASAAIEHAVALEAARRIDAEVAGTRQRRRAVAHRVVPRLEAALAAITAAIEEAERADIVRLRSATGARLG